MDKSILQEDIPHGRLVIYQGGRCYIYFAAGLWIVQVIEKDKIDNERWFTNCNCYEAVC